MYINGNKTNRLTHNQGVDGSSPSGPTVDNQPLTIYFVGGFFFVASLAPGFEGKVGAFKFCGHRTLSGEPGY